MATRFTRTDYSSGCRRLTLPAGVVHVITYLPELRISPTPGEQGAPGYHHDSRRVRQQKMQSKSAISVAAVVESRRNCAQSAKLVNAVGKNTEVAQTFSMSIRRSNGGRKMLLSLHVGSGNAAAVAGAPRYSEENDNSRLAGAANAADVISIGLPNTIAIAASIHGLLAMWAKLAGAVMRSRRTSCFRHHRAQRCPTNSPPYFAWPWWRSSVIHACTEVPLAPCPGHAYWA